jgi:hypothetical protein
VSQNLGAPILLGLGRLAHLQVTCVQAAHHLSHVK